MKETQSWPLPDDVRTGAKSDEAFNTFLKWDQELQDRKWLSTISLSQLGYAVEFTIHNNLHMRYATERAPEGFDEANENGGAPFPFDGNFPKNWRFDSPKYNWLADPYGAALNPVFWKIHGYVDHLIDVWLAANKKKYDSISENCKGNKRCYEWKGTWVGEEGQEAAPKAYKADTAPLDAKSIAEFTRKRIANQRAGVLTDGIKAPDSFGSKEAAPLSPFEIAKKRLCNID
jgi:hypothetical protein